MAKNKLNVEFSYDFVLLGIISPLKEYKLAWKINKCLEINLVKEVDVEIEFFNQSDLVISNFLYQTENSEFRLLKNKSVSSNSRANVYLLPELQSFDYVVMVSGFEDTFSIDTVKSELQAIPGVQYIKLFDVESLKSRENLIF